MLLYLYCERVCDPRRFLVTLGRSRGKKIDRVVIRFELGERRSENIIKGLPWISEIESVNANVINISIAWIVRRERVVRSIGYRRGVWRPAEFYVWRVVKKAVHVLPRCYK